MLHVNSIGVNLTRFKGRVGGELGGSCSPISLRTAMELSKYFSMALSWFHRKYCSRMAAIGDYEYRIGIREGERELE